MIEMDGNHGPNSDLEGNPVSRGEKLLAPFVWLAGARWSVIQRCPATERGRVAVIGSTVLVPTLLGFFGMYYYISSRSSQSNLAASVGLSFVWSLIILVIDRSLLATYRPFLPWFHKSAQVCFRFVLA